MASAFGSREAEEVLDIKRDGDKLMCLVKWKNFPVSESEYVPTYDLQPGMERFVPSLRSSQLLFVLDSQSTLVRKKKFVLRLCSEIFHPERFVTDQQVSWFALQVITHIRRQLKTSMKGARGRMQVSHFPWVFSQAENRDDSPTAAGVAIGVPCAVTGSAAHLPAGRGRLPAAFSQRLERCASRVSVGDGPISVR
jgi:hypothetical protein